MQGIERHMLASPFWKVDAADPCQRVSADGSYWWDNSTRREKSVVLHYVLEGVLVYVDRHGRKTVDPGWAVMFAHGEHSAYGVPREVGQTLLTAWVVLSGAGTLEHWNLLRRRFGSVFYMGHASPLRRAMRRLDRHLNPASSAELALAATAVNSFVMRLYEHLEDRAGGTKTPVERAVDELIRHPTHPWSLKEVAARWGCSREHLTRVFTERVGAPPAKYLTEARIDKALELLRATSLSLALIAEHSGFGSSHAMARWVRARTGHAPSVVRQSARASRHPDLQP
jgi:AraC-like DNA-binding protein